MKTMNKLCKPFLYAIFFVVFLHMLGSDAIAAEDSAGWRPIYDIIMKWVNLGILVFLIVKYGKKPLTNFLGDQKEKLAQEIEQLEEEKTKFSTGLKETLGLIDKGDAHINKIKERIAEQGKKEKERIIKQGKQQSAAMIEESKKKIQTKLMHAKNIFRDELIDAAISLALKRLPSEMMEEDNLLMTNQYLAEIESR